jgi:hypothetical protein
MRKSLVGGLALFLCTAFSGLAGANGFRHSAPAQGAQALYKVRRDHYVWVDRTSLPGHGAKAAERIKALKQSMEDEIEGTGHFVKEEDTPAFEIVSHGAHLKQVSEAGYGSDNNGTNKGVARYQVKASELGPGHTLDVTKLLPVSGHVGLSNAQTYAKTNVFRTKINDGAWENVPASGKYVTEKRVTLTLKPGMNKIMMEPYAGGHGGYDQGRTIEIEVVP